MDRVSCGCGLSHTLCDAYKMTSRYEEARLVESSRTRATFIARLTELKTARTYGHTCANEDKSREIREQGLAEVARNKKLAP